MAGGLMQLVAYGAQDVYLTGNPQITFFKVVYRRHTNFSMEHIEHSLNGNPDFGRRSTVCITRNGDLINEIYLMVSLPKIDPCNCGKFAWVRRLGNALIEQVEIEIGGSRIDRQFGIWFDIWFELARPAGAQARGYNKMVGDVPELTRYDSSVKQPYLLFIPLLFWFNRHVGLALPLIALQYHEVRIHFDFRRAEELIVANSTFKDFNMDQVKIQDARLLVNYIYLDSEERRRFAQVGHEYLIEQLQHTGEESVTQQFHKYKLNFNHPSKELIWAMRMGNYNTGKAFMNYTHELDWSLCGPCGILHETAVKLLKESIVVKTCEEEDDCYIDNCDEAARELAPRNGGCWQAFCPSRKVQCEEKYGCITVVNNTSNKILFLNADSLIVKGDRGCPDFYTITGKICAEIILDDDCCKINCPNECDSSCSDSSNGSNGSSSSGRRRRDKDDCDVVCSNVSSTLTVRDLSIPIELMCDTRIERDDPCVFQCWNFGVLIDGSENPVNEALLQLNGHDRFKTREGSFFNYVQPWERHTNTPADGINVYSFAINPEEHQPSGSANLSRIDNTQLNILFKDPTLLPGLPCLNFLNSDNKLFIFDVSYNVLRVMSGMGGLAYSN
uniref:Major capsid protein n=1 Tax=Mimivirus LCMiAC01 TaxID=2506608 RepID=A0A481Z1A9_9VIRU|nr:MAG: major capsid protein [Mimivirus LCMiAC01]